MKLLIVTALYGRPDLTEIILNYYNQLKSELDLELLAVGSEGDESKYIAQFNGWDYIEYLNEPLNEKFNVLSFAARNYQCGGIMLIGSDDLVSRSIIEYYISLMKSARTKMYGFKGCHFFDCATGTLKSFRGYFAAERNCHTVGAGRFFPLATLQRVGWQLWSDEPKNKSLDTDCFYRLQSFNVPEQVLIYKRLPGMIIDVKTGFNITPIEKIRNSKAVPDAETLMQKFFPEETIQRILKLKMTGSVAGVMNPHALTET